MKGVVLEQTGPAPRLMIKDLPLPALGDYDVLVKVGACGFCHHDLLVMEGVLRRGVKLPLVLGHEIAGTVAEIGPRVTAVQLGERVVCLPTNVCGRCQRCLQGQDRRCLEGRGLGHVVDGGIAQYVKIQENSLINSPSQIPWEHACLLACPIGVALQGINEARIQTGETVVVTGAGGGLGVHLIQLARNLGARVLAVTSSEGKVNFLSKLGAHEVIVNGELDFSEVVLALTNEKGAEVIMDTVGSPLFSSSLRSLAPYGRMVVVGEVSGSAVQLNLADLIFRDARLIGSVGTSKLHLEQAARLVLEGKVQPIVSHVLPWNQTMEAYKLLKTRESIGRVALNFTTIS